MLKKFVKIILYIFAGLGSLFVLAIILAIFLEDDEVSQTHSTGTTYKTVLAPTRTPTPTAIPIVIVNLRDMLDQYEGNKIAATKKWKDIFVETEGLVSEFNENYFDIIPIQSDAFQMSGARCYPLSGGLGKMSDLLKGDRVKIIGKHTNVLGSLIRHIRIHDCVFEKR